MKILFLSLVKIDALDERGIYTDLLRELARNGHEITSITPVERRDMASTTIKIEPFFTNIRVKTFNVQKTGILEKGIGMLAISGQFKKAIKKYIAQEPFDLILYSTPPITLYPVIKWLKKRTRAKTYLLLKDIFPQNAVDMNMMKEYGIMHKYFSKIEKKLYKISDFIGCMSPANVAFLKKHHAYIDASIIHENPNSIEPSVYKLEDTRKKELLTKYKLPSDKKIFVYGGNLGIPQGIDFLIEVLDKVRVKNGHFLVVGNGSEYKKLAKWFETKKPTNATLIQVLPKAEYDLLLQCCHVGLIFLSYLFLIPNFPSRLLSYLEIGLPVIAATDSNTDIGKIIEEYKCGKAVLAGDLKGFKIACEEIIKSDETYAELSVNSRYLLEHKYTVKASAEILEGYVQ